MGVYGRGQYCARFHILRLLCAASTHEVVCQACHRINDRYPAGVVTLSGALTAQQKAAEKAEHPLNRIIDIEEGLDQIVINTTDIHLPRRGEAIKSARFTASSRGISTNMGISFV
jgi:hypothetical protein